MVLAGDAVADNSPGGVTPACRDLVARAVRQTMSDAERVSSLVRAGAGDALARLGDSRFLKNAWFLPNDPMLGLVEVPAGPFRMGSDKKRDSRAYDDETPQHEVTLPSYYIGRYPVTVAQFRTYVEDGGRTPEDPENVRGLANHPVVRVTWHEALAYCRWLAETLGASNETPAALRRVLQGDGVERPWQVTLPSEAEWEKAARGTDGRIYPWGNEADTNRANYDDTNINRTTAVGCFPTGTSPYGVEELSGTVWEWTRSLWGKNVGEPEFSYPYKPNQKRENLAAPTDVRRVLRGGSFYDSEGGVRAARRYGYFPDLRNYVLGFRVVVSPFSSDL